MYEKVNKYHPDKVADRIAGAIIDYAYNLDSNPKVAVEILIGHGNCNIIIETNVDFDREKINKIVYRIAGLDQIVNLQIVPQDTHLAHNQEKQIRCGDNGIFKGLPISDEEYNLAEISYVMELHFGSDGKYILNNDYLIICQSNATNEQIKKHIPDKLNTLINPLGYWVGGTNVDTGAVNRKLGSDMGNAVTGGGLHGKDLSKADVSINIFAHLLAQLLNKEINICCAIGDEFIEVEDRDIPYQEIVDIARMFIDVNFGFEKFAETGLIGSRISTEVLEKVTQVLAKYKKN